MSKITWFSVRIISIFIILHIMQITEAYDSHKIDMFIERVLASNKFNKIAEVIAEKTIERIKKLENMSHKKDKKDTGQIKDDTDRRHSDTLASLEVQPRANSLSDLSLKYKKLIGNFKVPVIAKDLNTTQEPKTIQFYEVKTKPTTIEDNSGVEMDKSDGVKQNNTDYESESEVQTEDAESQENDDKNTQKQEIDDSQSDVTTPEDIFSNKQKDLHGKKTVRKEGGKMYVFQSSSDYEEYHAAVDKVIKGDG